MVPQQDEDTAKLDQCEEVGLVIFPAGDQATEVMQPGKQSFDFPASAVAPEFTPVLGSGLAAVDLVRRDQFDSVLLGQVLVERIAVVSAVADHTFGRRRREALLDSGFDESSFMWRSACN